MFLGYKQSKRNHAAYEHRTTYWDIMLRTLFIPIVLMPLLTQPCAAAAQGFIPITNKSAFLEQVVDRPLKLGLFDLLITVKSDGTITGSALGWEVTGDWAWQDDLFCRKMNWGGMDIDYNCQLVEIDKKKVRFTSDGGQGRAASFTLD